MKRVPWNRLTKEMQFAVDVASNIIENYLDTINENTSFTLDVSYALSEA